MIARYGYMDETDVPRALAAAGQSCAARHRPRPTRPTTSAARPSWPPRKGQLGPLSERLFGFLSRNAASATSYFAIPPGQVIEIGTQIDL